MGSLRGRREAGGGRGWKGEHVRPWRRRLLHGVVPVLCLAAAACRRPPDLPDFGAVPEFSLTERAGRAVSKADLLGKAWIIDFIFTNCPGPCPRLSAEMRKLQADLPEEVRLLSVSVDPERDTPEVLREYAARFGASESRWWFLTGPRERIVAFAQDGFKLPVMTSEAGDAILHSTRFVLIDSAGTVRGYYEGEDSEALKTLRRDVKGLLPSFLRRQESRLDARLRGHDEARALAMLPAVNAVLNGTSAVLLGAGFYFIRRKRVAAHRACMIGALTASAVFLASYLTYHYSAGVTHFAGTGWARPFYFALLGSHTVLAAVIVPLVILTVVRALKKNFERHRRVARWTLPLWLYVSVTGVLVYLMLYHFFPSPRSL